MTASWTSNGSPTPTKQLSWSGP